MSGNILHVAIAWSNLPIYAASSIKQGLEVLNSQTISVISSYPDIPIHGVEEILGQEIIRINLCNAYSWADLDLPVPNIFFHTGWNVKSFNSLAAEVRRNGGSVILMMDNSWKNTFRQWIGKGIFHFAYSRRFSAIWVPGESSYRLCRFFGVVPQRIYTGLYCASTDVFRPGCSLHNRDRLFLFVGRFIKRKGVDLLIEAFSRFHGKFPDWHLKLVGCGELEDFLREIRNIEILPFLPSELVAKEMRQSRFFILPSREDHWGVVIHEATLSGCGVIVSDGVGAALDLVSKTNGFIFQSGSSEDLYQSLVKAASYTEDQLNAAYEESLNLASKFSANRWKTTFSRILHNHTHGFS